MRRATSCVLLVAALVLPALARADDPLLSGYGGPGGGDQSLLGDVVLSGPGSGGGGTPGRTAAGAPASLAAPPTPAASDGRNASARRTPSTEARGRSSAGTGAGSSSSPGGDAAGSEDATRAVPAPAVRTAETRAAPAGTFPLTTSGLLVALLALTALGGLYALTAWAQGRADPAV